MAEFRRIALADPQLPTDLLPADWIGTRARGVAARMYAAVAERSERFLVATADPALAGPRPTPDRFKR